MKRLWLPLLLCLAIGLCGCAGAHGGRYADRTTFPDNYADLIAMAQKAFRLEGPVDCVGLSLTAARRAHTIHPEAAEPREIIARNTLWLLEFVPEDDDRADWAKEGYDHASYLVEKRPDEGRYHFWAGALLGFRLQESLTPNLARLGRVQMHMQKAVDLVPSYNEGAPLRALGLFLVRVPGWPTGPGDPESGLEVLERAVKEYPQNPGNWLGLAEARLALGDLTGAQTALIESGHLLLLADWGVPGQTWQKQMTRLSERAAQ